MTGSSSSRATAATPNEAEAQSVTVSLPRPKTCPASVPSLIPLQGSPPVLPSTTTSTAPNTTTTMPSCPAPAFDIMALDGAGNLWIVSPLGTEPGVAELALPAGSVPSAETPAEAFALPRLERRGHPATRTFDNQGCLGVARAGLRDAGGRGPDRRPPVLSCRRTGWNSRRLCPGTSPEGRTVDDLNRLRNRTNEWGNGLRSLVAGLRSP